MRHRSEKLITQLFFGELIGFWNRSEDQYLFAYSWHMALSHYQLTPEVLLIELN